MKNIMKKAVLLSPVAMLGFFVTTKVTPTLAFADEPEPVVEEKTIYFDFSLNESFSLPNDRYYVSFISDIDEETEIDLTTGANGIYSASLPVEVLNDGFTVNASKTEISQVPVENPEPGQPEFEEITNTTVYSSDELSSNGILSKIGYNYLALAKGDEEVIAPLEGYGYYGARTEDPGATYATQRVWLSGAEIKDSKKAFGEANAVSYVAKNETGAEEFHIIDMTETSNGTEKLYFADIPFDATTFNFLRIANAENHNCCVYSETNVPSISYGSCYTVTSGVVSATNVDKATADTLAQVVEAYLTYGKDASNGSLTETVRSLYTTWFENKAATDAELKNAKIKDYVGYTNNGNSYEGLIKTSTFTVYEKWNTLCSQAGIDPKTGKDRKIDISGATFSKKTILLISAGVLGFMLILGVGAFFLRRYHTGK